MSMISSRVFLEFSLGSFWNHALDFLALGF